MANYAQRDLYGGAITVLLPSDCLDSSDLRQIPDHQEVFLSPRTLTSIIFEINEYISTKPDIISASQYHIHDVISPPDQLLLDTDNTSTQSPTSGIQQIRLSNPTVAQFPASILKATIMSQEIDRSAPTNLPPDWQTTQPTKETWTRVIQLVVRMQEYTTDFCVRINVPMKEMEGDETKQNAEWEFGVEMMTKIVQSLDVKDFGLFGGE